MKSILTIFLFFGLVVSSFSQTRNVVVDTNGVVVQPTNIWTANATNVRSGLGLGSAATNPASAFQPSSATLSNLASSNGVNLTNISVSGVVGALSTNGNGFGLTNLNASNITGVIRLTNVPTLSFTNISGTLAIASGGTGSTNTAGARANLDLGWSALTNTNAATSLLGFATNGQVVANTGTNVLTFTNEINAGGIKSAYLYANIGTNTYFYAADDMVEIKVPLEIYGEYGINFNSTNAAATTRANLGFSTNLNTLWEATTASNARSAIGLGRSDYVYFNALNVPDIATRLIQSTGISQGTNAGLTIRAFNLTTNAEFYDTNVIFYTPISWGGGSSSANATTTRTNLGLGATWLTNTNVTQFRTDIGLSGFETVQSNSAATILKSSSLITNANYTLAVGPYATAPFNFSYVFNASGFPAIFSSTNIDSFNVKALGGMSLDLGTNGIIFRTNASAAATRTNLGLGATWLTNTNVTNFRTDIGLGNSNVVSFGPMFLQDQGTYTLALGNTNTGFRLISGAVSRYGFHKQGVLIWDIAATNDTFNVAVPMTFGQPATTRTNLGLGWPALTNTNAGTGLVSVNTNGEVVSPTNFWQVAPIQTLVQDFTAIATSQTNNATNARNVYIYSFNTNVSGLFNTIILPTNTSTFNGDEVTVVHKGTTNTTTIIRQDGSTNNLITLNKFDESVKFIRELGQWDFYHNISFVEPIQFSGTNASENIAITRTNLGLGSTNTVVFGNIDITTNGIISIPASGTNTVEVNIGSQGIEFNGNKTNGLISFIGTNLASAFRSDIGLPLAALTNTNAAKFQEAIFTTNAAPTNPATPNFGDYAAWMGVSIVTNGVTNTFKIPLYK